jgi:RNA polymerase sigma-70 factor (ECF subfamily)
MNPTGATIAVNRAEAFLGRSRRRTAADFADVYRRFGKPLYGTALRMMRRREDAEDAVQDTFLAYHGKAPSLSDDAVGPWLRRVLINRCLDRLRRGRRWQESEVEEATLTTAPARADLKVDLETAVAALPEKARVVFVLHDVEGLMHREISELLEVSEGTTKSQLFRARRLLREAIESTPGETS